MVSGLGFQNTADEEHSRGPRKKTVSRGLLVAMGFLVVVIIVWVGLKMQNQSLDKKLEGLKTSTKDVNIKTATALSEEASDSALRAYAMEDELYTQYESNVILDEIEDIMILKSSDDSNNRVVLKSFQHNAGANTKRVFADGDATTTGAGSVTITADSDTFDVMAQQIKAFKNSSYFENVQVGTTDRDDSGRIVFTLTMDVVGYDKSPYEGEGSQDNVTVDTNQQQGAIEVNDNNGTQVIVGDDGVNVKNDNTEVVASDDNTSVQTDNVDVQATQ